MRKDKVLTAGLFFMFAFLGVVLCSSRYVGIYTLALFTWIGVQLFLSTLVRVHSYSSEQDRLKVLIVVPFYNEDLALFAKMLSSLAAQSRMPDRIWLVDDGSASRDCIDYADAWAAGRSNVAILHQRNGGKRSVLAIVCKREVDIDILINIDSDTILHPNAISEGLKPFSDPTMMAVTGFVLPVNFRKNLLTRLMDVRYATSFLSERAMFSLVGSVTCVCGALAFYRAQVVRDNIEDFVQQRFLGALAEAGEDRRLTNYALLRGRVVLQPTAKAETAVPEKFGHYLRQQVRWQRSFVRESIWAAHHLPANKPAPWISIIQLSQWIVFPLVTPVIFFLNWVTGAATLVIYIAWVMILLYARSLRFFDSKVERSAYDRFMSFLVTPLYAFLYIGVLMPIRIYSVVTLRKVAWGTRKRVEVADSDVAKFFVGYENIG